MTNTNIKGAILENSKLFAIYELGKREGWANENMKFGEMRKIFEEQGRDLVQDSAGDILDTYNNIRYKEIK